MTAPAFQIVTTGSGLPHAAAPDSPTTLCGAKWTAVTDAPGLCGACATFIKDRFLPEVDALAKQSAWKRGDLSYKLDATQRGIVANMDAAWKQRPINPNATAQERLKAIAPSWYFLLLSRGFGKSVICCTKSLEIGRTVPGARMYYAAPEKKDAIDIVRDTVELKLLTDCPKELRPVWSPGDSLYTFPETGAVWRFKGVNNENADTLRGPGAHFFVLDEAGGMDEVDYVVRSVVDPMITRDGWHGKLLLATTPAKTGGHGSEALYSECMDAGISSTHTLLDNVRLSWEDKAKALRSCGEKDADIPAILEGKMPPRTTTARREYFCSFVVDGASMVHPAWPDLEHELTVKIESAA